MSVHSNCLYCIARQVLILILPLPATSYVSRVLGDDGVDTDLYPSSVAYYFVFLAMFNNYGRRSIAMMRGNIADLNRTFRGIWAAQAAMRLVGTCIFIMHALLIANNWLFAVVLMPDALTGTLINGLFFSPESFKITVLRRFDIKLSLLALVFVAVRCERALSNCLLLISFNYFASVTAHWPLMNHEVAFVRPQIVILSTHRKPKFKYRAITNVLLRGFSRALSPFDCMTARQMGLFDSLRLVLRLFFVNLVKGISLEEEGAA